MVAKPNRIILDWKTLHDKVQKCLVNFPFNSDRIYQIDVLNVLV